MTPNFAAYGPYRYLWDKCRWRCSAVLVCVILMELLILAQPVFGISWPPQGLALFVVFSHLMMGVVAVALLLGPALNYRKEMKLSRNRRI